jgi:hypothetical protein
MTQQILGTRMYYAVFLLAGRPTRGEGARLLDLVIGWAGMHKLDSYRRGVWEYPTPEGLGGTGVTAVQPFTMVQPFAEMPPQEPLEIAHLQESYAYLFIPVGLAAMDTYIEHDHFFLEIASCKVFKPSEILYELHRRRWEVLGFNKMTLGSGEWAGDVDFHNE